MPKIFNDLDSAKAFFADIPESESKPRTVQAALAQDVAPPPPVAKLRLKPPTPPEAGLTPAREAAQTSLIPDQARARSECTGAQPRTKRTKRKHSSRNLSIPEEVLQILYAYVFF